MREVLRALNALVKQRVIEEYAIGGAIGAAFYIAAVQTEDVDAFVFLPPSASGLIDLRSIYSALTREGGRIEREYVKFGDWPLQILPDNTALVRLAIREAVDVEYEGIPTRVFRPEHLCGIALETGRPKDTLRVRAFLEEKAVDLKLLGAVADTFGLGDRLSKVRDA